MFRRRLETKTLDQLRLMRQAGRVVAAALAAVQEHCRAGVSTLELDALAEDLIRLSGARPSFPEVPGYQHTLCVSVNDEVVHGIPGSRVLADGDLVSIDCGAIMHGWHGDAAISLIVGGPGHERAEDRVLVDATEAALWAGIGAFRVGGRVGDIGAAVEDSVIASDHGYGFGIVRDYEGHGIGREMHMPPGVANHRRSDLGPKVRSGATVAIEPMITLGEPTTRVLEDDWTVVTVAGGRAAHWEHSVAVTDTGVCVLTAADGGKPRLAGLGVAYLDLDE